MSKKIIISFFIIIGLMIVKSESVFASDNQKITVDNIKSILNYYNPNGYNTELYTEERIQDLVNTANSTSNGVIYYDKGINFYLLYNFVPEVRGTSNYYFNGTSRSYIQFDEKNNNYKKTKATFGTLYLNMADYLYCIGGWKNTSNNGIEYIDGWTNNSDIKFSPEKPYFEWAGKRIGTTNVENFEENLSCFYPSSFKTHVNSYASFKKIGTLYISKDYIISNIYTSTPTINIYNMSQTQSWSYKNYLIFTDKTVTNGMIAYDINIDTNYINTPYIYSIPLISQDEKLANDIYINFVLLTETTEGGGIIVESGDQNISGDFTKDETTLGDIQNSINNIFQKPNEEELKKEQEENINQIKEQITNQLKDNKVFSALTTAEQGLIEILEGEPRRF